MIKGADGLASTFKPGYGRLRAQAQTLALAQALAQALVQAGILGPAQQHHRGQLGEYTSSSVLSLFLQPRNFL